MKKEDEASVRDSGAEPYRYNEYVDYISRVYEQLKYRFTPEIESQFKKPYLQEDHVESERTYTGPGVPGPRYPPNLPPPFPWLPFPNPDFPFPIPTPTMPPGGGGGGAGPSTPGPNFPPSSPSEPSPDEPTVSPHISPCEKCATFAFPGYDHIFQVEAVGGTITDQRKTGDNTLSVKICWLDDAGEVKAIAYHDIFRNSEIVELSTQKHSCCGNCADIGDPVIDYTSQQMVVNETQELFATGGGSVYTWTVTGGGSLSNNTGDSTIYTAPSSNANCANNPTITLTDCCEHTDTLELAINEWSGSELAYTDNQHVCVCANPGEYTCDNQQNTGSGWIHSCCHGQFDCNNNSLGLAAHAGLSTDMAVFNCVNYSTTWCAANCSSYTGADVRTTAMKNGGCCPAGLL